MIFRVKAIGDFNPGEGITKGSIYSVENITNGPYVGAGVIVVSDDDGDENYLLKGEYEIVEEE